MKIRIETAEEEEIVIRCPEITEHIRNLEARIAEALRAEDRMTLYADHDRFFVEKREILFFESSGGKVYAHTADAIFTAPHKLFELEDLLPSCFVRISKSAIANVNRISHLRREAVGNGELSFFACRKTVWFSRAYYKLLQHKLEEMR